MTAGAVTPWLLSAGVPLALLALSLPARRLRWPLVPSLLREAGIVSAVFLVWQLPTRMSAGNLDAAVARARWIHHWEQRLGLPDEAAWQHAVLPHPWLVQTANYYYLAMHFGAMAALLVWMFWRHRADYARVRTGIVLVTVVSLLAQTVAVAPPRLVARLGFADTAERYGQSVYGGGPGSVVADELSAVPSVHIAWALLIALAVVRIGRRGVRWLVVAHPVLTLVVVVVTANHFWFDALAAVAVVVLCMGLGRAARACRRALTTAARPARAAPDPPAPTPRPAGSHGPGAAHRDDDPPHEKSPRG
ncbi:phosphatase PAP2 family protein [Streptomyces albus subsp. chlorinus]|uniref:phosphatase PAP2 family protein n=1 Tax=Streptomyces albus TaxID=1888 RepID=UPI0031F60532